MEAENGGFQSRNQSFQGPDFQVNHGFFWWYTPGIKHSDEK